MSIVLLTLMFSLFARATDLTEGGEYYVLNKQKLADGKWRMLVMDAHSSDPHGYVFTYDPKSSALNLFDNSKVGLIAFPTNELDQAIYIKAKKPITVSNADAVLKKLKADPAGWKRLTARHNNDINGKMTATNATQPVEATDTNVACPAQPQRKNGKLCEAPPAVKVLPPTLMLVIENAAKKYNVPAGMIASIIHQETGFNPFVENEDTKRQCQAAVADKPCPDYKWEKGFAQLGANNAREYGLDWNKMIPRTSACDEVLNETCMSYLEKECTKVPVADGKPMNCPSASVEAVAKHLSDASLPADMKVTIPGKEPVDLKKKLFPGKNSADEIRNRVGFYNRGPRVIDSYYESLFQTGQLAKNYGEAWATPRVDSTPSKEMGFRILQGEYVNRCYVWRVAGLCGEIPAESFYGQYSQMFAPPSESDEESESATAVDM